MIIEHVIRIEMRLFWDYLWWQQTRDCLYVDVSRILQYHCNTLFHLSYMNIIGS